MTEQILLRVPKELKEILQTFSRKKGLTLNGLILQILWNWDEEQKQLNKKEVS